MAHWNGVEEKWMDSCISVVLRRRICRAAQRDIDMRNLGVVHEGRSVGWVHLDRCSY